jgi:beta-lactamase class A
MVLQNGFRSIVDQSPYALSPADDSDSTVYALVGQAVPLRHLAARMITHSSNLATNALITRLDPQRITALARHLGATRMQVLRGVEDNVLSCGPQQHDDGQRPRGAVHRAATGRVANVSSTWTCWRPRGAGVRDEIPAGLPPAHRAQGGSITAVTTPTGVSGRSRAVCDRGAHAGSPTRRPRH